MRNPLKPKPEPTYDERMRAALLAVAEKDNWPSVRVDPASQGGAALPAGLPALPTISPPPAELDVARAQVAEMTALCTQLEVDLSVAYEQGDVDTILAVRRQREELTLRAWSAARAAVETELAHYEAEQDRISGWLGVYNEPLDALHATIRDLQEQATPLVEAAQHVERITDKIAAVTGRLHRDLDRLRTPNDFVAAGNEGWEAMTRNTSDVYRSVDFTPTSSGDGLTLEGYAAVFDTPTRIDSVTEGTFDEVIARGAFAKTIRARKPVMQFDHGRDPAVGAVPIGAIEDLREDTRGLFVRARMHDNSRVEPIRHAIASGAISGMSFRFSPVSDRWSADRSLRTLTEVELFELGPVVFPAYATTSVGVRTRSLRPGPAQKERPMSIDEQKRAILQAHRDLERVDELIAASNQRLLMAGVARMPQAYDGVAAAMVFPTRPKVEPTGAKAKAARRARELRMLGD